MAACGTRSGYASGCTCRPCKDANNAYFRERNSGLRDEKNRQQRAEQRAFRRLAAAHPAEFDDLLARELRREVAAHE